MLVDYEAAFQLILTRIVGTKFPNLLMRYYKRYYISKCITGSAAASLGQNVHSPNLLKRKCISEVVRDGSI